MFQKHKQIKFEIHCLLLVLENWAITMNVVFLRVEKGVFVHRKTVRLMSAKKGTAYRRRDSNSNGISKTSNVPNHQRRCCRAIPYEEVAYEITSLANSNQNLGMGMIGHLPKV